MMQKHWAIALTSFLVFGGSVAAVRPVDVVGQVRTERFETADESVPLKYWVFFTDKESIAGAKSTIERVDVTDRARRRRALRASSVARELDRPISGEYVRQLDELGVVVQNQSRWLNAVSASLRADQIRIVESLPFVKNLRPVGATLVDASALRPVPLVFQVASQSIYEKRRLDYGMAETQLSLVNAIQPIEEGIIGTGVLLGFLDTTFGQFSHPVFSQLVAGGRVIAQQDFSIGPQTNTHGMSVASVAVGFSEGNLIGPAYGASVAAATTEFAPTETNQEEDDFVAGLEWLETQGVDVVSTSLGYSTFDAGQFSYATTDLDGDTGVATIASDHAASLGVVVVSSAGNEGCASPSSCWYYVTTPADGDSVIAVGGVDASRFRVSFSSRGPTADGRIKPDVAAMAVSVQIASGGGYALSGGTSFAAPMVSGVVAQMLQVNPNLTPNEVIQILKTTSSQHAAPDNDLGWGIVDAGAAVNFARQVSVDRFDDTPAFVNIQSTYPNPATDRVTMSLLTTGDTVRISVVVYDVLGRVVVPEVILNANRGRTDLTMDVRSLASGLYNAVVFSEGVSRATTFFVVR